MASPYFSGSSGSSPYFSGGTSGGVQGAPAASSPKPSGGGIFGKIVSAVTGTAGQAAHIVASKADLAVHDIAAMPGGFVVAGKAFGQDVATSVEHPERPIGPSWGQIASHPLRASNANGSKLYPIATAAVKQAGTSIAHPLRDPFQTGLTFGAIVSAGAGAAARAADAADAAQAGDIGSAARALVTKPAVKARIVQVPKLVAPEGEGPAELVHEPVQLQALTNSAVRAAQAVHDAVVQRTLDRNPSPAEPSAIVNYAGRRVGKVGDETARTGQRVRLVPAQLLARTGKHFDDGVSRQAGQLSLFLRSANVTGKEASNYWTGQAARGVNPGETGKLAQLAQQVHDQGLIGLGEDGNVHVNAGQFPKLGNADALVKENQAAREATIQQHGLMSSEGAQARLDLVAQKMGVDRQGQGFTSLKTTVKGQPQNAIAASRTPVIGKVRAFVGGKKATGAGVAKGLIPDNTTAGVARAAQEAIRYEGTVEHRGIVAKYGSDARRTGQDVLVADPAANKYGEINPDTNELLGRTKSTLNTIPEEEHIGLAAGMKARLEDSIPGLKDNFATDRAAGLGTRAPQGYKWVPKQMLGDLVEETAPRTGITKKINDVNSAVTAATVYFKLSHIPQRLSTNAAANFLQGSLTKGGMKDAIEMRKAIGERDYARAVAASGTHGYMALPHEGTSNVARVASKGAGFYARRIDSPFRFTSLVYEAKKAGFDTPEKFRALLDHAEHPTAQGMNAAQAAKMDWVLRRANRASLMYDGLGSNEKRILARGLWFYPWTKAAVRFTAHTISEHPLKSAVGGAAGKLGEQQQAQDLGAIPSYEYNLIPFSGGSNPLTSDISGFTPFGTAANVAELGARPGGLVGNLNPVSGAVLTALSGVNQYGDKTTSPIGDAASQLFASTPEFQALSAYLHPSKPTAIFRKTPGSALARALGGTPYPRRANRAALNKAAATEKKPPKY